MTPFIAKFKEKILKKSYPIADLIVAIENIRNRSAILNLCAQPTGYSWLGVRNAGYSLFPDCSAEIPQYYSNQVLSDNQLTILGQKIGDLKFEQLIFNGHNIYFELIIDAAIKANPKIRIGSIHHGFFAEMIGDSPVSKISTHLLQCLRRQKIHKIAFLKKGNSDVFNALTGVKKFEIFNQNPRSPLNPIPYKKSIGVMTNDSFRKNTSTQVIAALCLKDYEVMMVKEAGMKAFDFNNKIVETGPLAHEDFIKSLSQNCINSHVTFSEASGGQAFTESLAMGVPCLTALTSGYLDDSEALQKALIVDRFDDAWAIAEKMKELIEQRDSISSLCVKYSEEMNKKADDLLLLFLNG